MSGAEIAVSGLPQYGLRLFVAGTSARSVRSIENLNRICAVYLVDRYELEIVDIYQQPELAERDHVMAAPMLLKHRPAPSSRIVGDLSNEQAVLHLLDLGT